MKRFFICLRQNLSIMVLALGLSSSIALCQDYTSEGSDKKDDRTLSPYFFVKNEEAVK